MIRRLGSWCPNFVASTLFAAAGLAALLAIMANGHTELLAIDWQTATLISLVLAYAQRSVIRVLERTRRVPLRVFLLEPLVTNLVHLVGLAGAIGSLGWAAVHSKRGCGSGPPCGRA